ncbi:hypothetical protein LWI28_000011 [Acer negundo]|uniref:Uncharacterized protein n=1 Tax=Acer negundo TaxID=4023 RepID=A0AAD5J375_ACENE|nr:hypothetical protein LWI28_000011 [Acer negundo]KAK4849943.1 hypothetical protein QYF36_002290 [Acer negundo]
MLPENDPSGKFTGFSILKGGGGIFDHRFDNEFGVVTRGNTWQKEGVHVARWPKAARGHVGGNGRVR